MSDAALPSLHQLRSACLAARVLHFPQTGLADARESFQRLPSDGVFGARDFDAGQQVLASVGLIAAEGVLLNVGEAIVELASVSRDAGAQLLLELVLERRPPAWLSIAAGGSALRAQAVPERDLSALCQVVGDPSLREAILLRAARRHDAARLAALGAAGEEHVMECCRSELLDAGADRLAGEVVQVSRISDQLGYDIVAPRLDGGSRRLEVKATRRLRWRGEVFLSRNEFEVGLRDPDWALVVVEIESDGAPKLVGWTRAEGLEPMMPGDRHADGRWVSASLAQASALLAPGLPPI